MEQEGWDGHFDAVRDGVATGWARGPSDAPVWVVIRAGGRVLARGRANRFRADLLEAGIGNGCHAFEVALPSGGVADGSGAVMAEIEPIGYVLRGSHNVIDYAKMDVVRVSQRLEFLVDDFNAITALIKY